MDLSGKPTETSVTTTNQGSEAKLASESMAESGGARSATLATSEPVASSNVSQSHQSTAQKVFSGRPNVGLMCNNLRANPFSVNENSSHSQGILAKPRFSLKPSTFGATEDSKLRTGATGDQTNSSAAAPSNPFLRPAKLSYETDETGHNTGDGESTTTDAVSSSNESTAIDNTKHADASGNSAATDSKIDSTSDSTNTLVSSSLDSKPTLFGSSSGVSQSTFVFGESLDSRVTNVTKENGADGHSDSDEPQKPKALTLEEAADEYKKQQESGPLLPEVETVTGEEEEANVLQINCKLFLFNDKDSSWAEKGRGCLRLNDHTTDAHSRIVMRTAGIHRVILNTNIWPAMICERANQKSIRITGTESEQVHVYLITGSPADIDHLYNAVTYRTQRLKQQAATSISKGDSEAAATKRPAESEAEADSKKPRLETSPKE